MDDLMTEYDVIVLGTGMTESILAAALARIGKSVLHVDSNDYYGENWASFSFDGIQKWIGKIKEFQSHQSPNEFCNNIELKEHETFHSIQPKSSVKNISQRWYNKNCQDISGQMLDVNVDDNESKLMLNECDDSNDKDIENIKKLFSHNSRRFNMDICPKVLFSRGLLVELLISSNIAKYAEFKSVTRVLTWRNECLEQVPCSRADVFSTKNISVVEKRLLVKILTIFLKYPENTDEFTGFENKTFFEYLKHKKLPNNLLHYLLFAMAMGNKNMPCIEGVKSSKAFLESLGRYGNTPFIFPMYGSGEMPQCFCRLCAVFGGVYCLKREIHGLIVKNNRCTGIMSSGKRLNAETFILSRNYLPSDLLVREQRNEMSRGIFVTDRSISSCEKEPLTLLVFPPVPQVSDNSVTVVELGPGTNTCPDKVFIVHMTTNSTADADSDLRHVVQALFQSESTLNESPSAEKPKVLWSLTWNMSWESQITSSLENVKICSGPNTDLDFNFSVTEAKRLFSEICPGEEFLPRAPDPDEIVLEEDEKTNESGSEQTVLEADTPVHEDNEEEREEKDGSATALPVIEKELSNEDNATE